MRRAPPIAPLPGDGRQSVRDTGVIAPRRQPAPQPKASIQLFQPRLRLLQIGRVEPLGEGVYVTTGQYDVVAILDMPDGDAMAKFILSVGAKGNARTTTVRAFPPDEISKIVSELP